MNEKYQAIKAESDIERVSKDFDHNELDNFFEEMGTDLDGVKKWLETQYGLSLSIQKFNQELAEALGVPSFNGDVLLLDTVADIEGVPSLPKGFAFSGGVARAALAKALDLPSQSIRDIDIVHLGADFDIDVANELARTYMPDDFAHGHGVKVEIEDYFLTRDFTWSEVLYYRGQILCTTQCLLDTLRHIVRFADYEKRDSYNGDDFYVADKLIAKALRMVAVAKHQGNNLELAVGDMSFLSNVEIDPFHLALHLDRALDRSVNAAEIYIKSAIERGDLPPECVAPENAVAYLKRHSNFLFRSERGKIYQEEIDCYNRHEHEYGDMEVGGKRAFWR